MISGRFLSLLYHTYCNFVRAVFLFNHKDINGAKDFFTNLLFFSNIFYKYNGEGKCEKIGEYK